VVLKQRLFNKEFDGNAMNLNLFCIEKLSFAGSRKKISDTPGCANLIIPAQNACKYFQGISSARLLGPTIDEI